VSLAAAEAFATWGPAHQHESAAALRALAADRRYYSHRVRAALALAKLDEQHRPYALEQILDAVATTGYFESATIRDAARSALELEPTAAEPTADVLRRHLAAPDPVGITHQQSALALSDLGPAYRREAVAALRSVLALHPNDGCRSLDIAARLSELSDTDSDALLEAFLTAVLAPEDERAINWACEEYAVHANFPLARAVDRLRVIASDSREDTERREYARQTLDTLSEVAPSIDSA
jgi:hypothetical protein